MKPVTPEGPGKAREAMEAPKYDAGLIALMISGVKDRSFPVEAGQRLEAAGYLTMLEDGTYGVPAPVEAMVLATAEWKAHVKAREAEAREFYRKQEEEHRAQRALVIAYRKERRCRV